MAIDAVNPVAAVVNVFEVVIGADFLKLGEGSAQRVVIPQADVAHRGFIPADFFEREVFDGGKLTLLESVERVGLARELDGAGDVRPLFFDFVGRHNKALDDLRINGPAEHAHDEQREERVNGRPEASAECPGEQGDGGHER